MCQDTQGGLSQGFQCSQVCAGGWGESSRPPLCVGVSLVLAVGSSGKGLIPGHQRKLPAEALLCVRPWVLTAALTTCSLATQAALGSPDSEGRGSPVRV